MRGYLNSSEVANALGVSRRRVFQLIETKGLPAEKLPGAGDGLWMVPEKKLQEWIQAVWVHIQPRGVGRGGKRPDLAKEISSFGDLAGILRGKAHTSDEDIEAVIHQLDEREHEDISA